MKQLATGFLIAIGLLNLYPAIGMMSAATISSLYGIPLGSQDLEVLMRHRAVMLGLIGCLLVYAAFRPALWQLAAVVGLISMASFVIIAVLVGDYGPDIHKVVLADVAGCIIALAVLAIAFKERSTLGDSSI